MDTGCSLEDLQVGIDDRQMDGEGGSQGNPCCQCDLMMMMIIHIYPIHLFYMFECINITFIDHIDHP